MQKNKDKPFDAVKTMRELRDALNRETAQMSYEEQKRYIRKRVRFDTNASGKEE